MNGQGGLSTRSPVRPLIRLPKALLGCQALQKGERDRAMTVPLSHQTSSSSHCECRKPEVVQTSGKVRPARIGTNEEGWHRFTS